MDSNSFTGLFNNAALLIALGVVYDSLGLETVANKVKSQLLSGVLIGTLGLVVMNSAWEVQPGIIYDSRWVLISLCGLFFGLIPTLIAATMMVTLRLYIGGIGAMAGCLMIIIPAGIALLWRYANERFNQPLDGLRLYLFGVTIQLCVVAILVLLSDHEYDPSIATLWLPLLLIFPIATLLLGLILQRQRQRHQTEQALTKSQLLLRGLLDALPDLISFKDPQGRYLGCNPAFEQYIGRSEAALIGKTATELRGAETGAAAIKSDNRPAATSKPATRYEQWVSYPDGNQLLHETLKTPFYGQDGTLFGQVSVSRDITERKTAEAQIHNLAFYDPLTQLPNRRTLMDRLQQMIAASARTQHVGALLFIDLDHFKTLNDSQGHLVGDQLLHSVAARLKHGLREADSVARLGGDEFVVLIGELGSDLNSAAAMAEKIAEKIQLRLREPYPLAISATSIDSDLSASNAELLYRCTPSIGISLFRSELGNHYESLKQADAAMYQAKTAGRDTIRFFDPAMQAALENKTRLLADLHHALSQDQLELFYQPQIDQHQGICGAEVLLRWHHPSRGMVSPLEFIPLAEESGLIIPIGRWVMTTACLQLKRWETIKAREHWQLAVNVSARQFQQPGFVDEVRDIVTTTAINPRRLKLELTESLVLVDIQSSIATMEQLRQLGIQFSMDDFGTGQSSLSNLKHLPLTQLKIDQSFVRDITTDPDDAAIIETIICLAKSLRYEVIAEGVETDAQRQFLYESGCSQYQGYLFGRPLPLPEFEAWLLSDSATLKSKSAAETGEQAYNSGSRHP